MAVMFAVAVDAMRIIWNLITSLLGEVVANRHLISREFFPVI